MGISQSRLALDLRVPPRRIHDVVLGRRRLTPDTALRRARYFGMSPQFWLGLQLDYDLDLVADEVGAQIEREVRVLAAS